MSLSWLVYRKILLAFLLLLPITFSAPMIEAASLRLNWTDNSDNEEGFQIERLTGGLFVGVATIGAGVQSYTDSGLTAGTNYCYRVRAFNAAGFSDPSNQACANAPSSGTSDVPPIGGGGGGGSGGGTSDGSGGTGGSNTNSITKWTDYRITLDMQSTNNGAIGVMFRYFDMNNYYRFSWNKQGKYRRLEKMQNGKLTVLAQDNARYSTGQTYHLVILAQGTTLSIWVDGALVFSVKDSSFTSGTVGLYSYYNRGSVFDNVLIEDLFTKSVLVWDDFNDGDLNGWTIIDDKGTKFGPSVWYIQNGALVQGSNIGSGTSASLGTFALYTRRDWFDYRLSFRMQSNDTDCLGAMFRYQDNRNYYRFSWCGSSRRLEKIVNGTLSVLVEDTISYKIGQPYQVEITALGVSLAVRIDGQSIFTVTDASFSQGSVALYSWWNQGSVFDDVLVEDLATGTVLFWDDFNDGDFGGWTIIDDGTSDAPSTWSAKTGTLTQSSNIGSNSSPNLGTFALH